MENKRYLLSFEDIENNVEVDIEGLVFKLRGIKDINYYSKLKDEDVEKEIEYILGNGSIEKINKLRNERGKEDLDVGTSLNLLLQLIGVYKKGSTINSTNTAMNVINEANNEIENMKNRFMNREQKRNYNRGHNKGYYRNYRRY